MLWCYIFCRIIASSISNRPQALAVGLARFVGATVGAEDASHGSLCHVRPLRVYIILKKLLRAASYLLLGLGHNWGLG